MKKVLYAFLSLVIVFSLIACNNNASIPTKYKVTFQSEGQEDSVVEVEENSKVTKPTDPTRDGYLFNGWYLNDEKFDFETSITSDITLVAKWITVWDGTIDTSWFSNDSSTKTATITTAAQLAGLVAVVNGPEENSEAANTLDGWTITLGIDVDLNNKKWTPIGKGERKLTSDSDYDGTKGPCFKGTFDGGSHTISNLSLKYYDATNTDDNYCLGFFGRTTGTVKDVTFSNATVESSSNTAGVAVGYAYKATISGVTVENSSVKSFQGAGVIAGRLYEGGTIENCKNINTSVTTTNLIEGQSESYNAAGIVGSAQIKAVNNVVPEVDNWIVISGNTVDLTSNADAKISANYETAGAITGTAFYVKFANNKILLNSTDQISVSTEGNNKLLIGYLFGNYGRLPQIEGSNTYKIGDGDVFTITKENNWITKKGK